MRLINTASLNLQDSPLVTSRRTPCSPTHCRQKKQYFKTWSPEGKGEGSGLRKGGTHVQSDASTGLPVRLNRHTLNRRGHQRRAHRGSTRCISGIGRPRSDTPPSSGQPRLSPALPSSSADRVCLKRNCGNVLEFFDCRTAYILRSSATLPVGSSKLMLKVTERKSSLGCV